MIKERPIIFNKAMVQAILAGRKTQTRRVVKPQPKATDPANCGHILWQTKNYEYSTKGIFTDFVKHEKCPYGVVGDLLWVRETFAYRIDECVYRADGEKDDVCSKWKPSIHMPRLTSRITLEITDVKVEKVQYISDADAKAEGVQPLTDNDKDLASYIAKRTGIKYKPAFSFLWDQINKNRGFGWEENPWVWVIKFRRIEI